MVKHDPPEGTKTYTWIEVVKAVGPLLIVGTIIVGIWRFQVERERDAASRYLNVIRDLGNEKNSVRAGAVITMDTYLRQGGRINEKYREQGVYVLATHLAIESDPLVRATTEEVLVNIGVRDEGDIVVRRLACSNRHLWYKERQEDPNLTIDSVIVGRDKASKNLQSMASTLIKIFQRKKRICSQTLEPLDLSKIYLTPYDSDAYALKEIELTNVQLEGACLVSMDLEKCVMQKCKLHRAYLNNASLRKATLIGINLEGADLQGADLTDANLKGANLKRAHLADAHLADANLAQADLEEAHLTDANLADAELPDAELPRADLPGANLKGADLSNAILTGAVLEQAILVDATLKDANLVGAILAGANLIGADLTRADLEGADLRAVVLFTVDSKNFQGDLEPSFISQNLRLEFEENGIYLSENVVVSFDEKRRTWLINDKDYDQTYTVREEVREEVAQLNICKETKFDVTRVKLASNWEKALYDYDR